MILLTKKIGSFLVALSLLALPFTASAAIAFGSSMNTVTHSSPTSPTFDSFTNTAGTLMTVCIASRTGGDQITGVQYASSTMTLVAKENTSAASTWLYIFKLKTPATGANNIATSFSGATDVRVGATSYTGANDVEASSTGTASAVATWSGSVTTVTANDWIGGCSWNDVSDNDAASPYVMRSQTPNNDPGLLDSNAATSTGSGKALSGTVHGGGSANWGFIVDAITPTAAAAAPISQFSGSSWWW